MLAASALALLLGGALLSRLAIADNSANYPAASLSAPTDPAALIARGKYLVIAGDCMPCHTGPGHAPFSGGLVINTPFGGLASPNITPDKATGIGNWTDQQFYNAVHYGVRPGRSYLVFPKFLYPAMPYTSYTKLSPRRYFRDQSLSLLAPPGECTPTPEQPGLPLQPAPRHARLAHPVLPPRPP